MGVYIQIHLLSYTLKICSSYELTKKIHIVQSIILDNMNGFSEKMQITKIYPTHPIKNPERIQTIEEIKGRIK